MKITEYQTINESTTNRLDQKVREAIVNGWQPYGNQYCIVDMGYEYFQVMVRYKEEK